MQKILCATGNTNKFNIGRIELAKFDIELVQTVLDIDEIQGEELETIIKDKSKKAFAELNEPVIVTDDSWTIPALNGFPGPYMKSINHWFKPEDFINLMRGASDRQVFLNQLVAYCDDLETVVFRSDIPAKLVTKPRGNYGLPFMKVIELNEDSLTISEAYDKAAHNDPPRLVGESNAWHELGTWLEKKLA